MNDDDSLLPVFIISVHSSYPIPVPENDVIFSLKEEEKLRLTFIESQNETTKESQRLFIVAFTDLYLGYLAEGPEHTPVMEVGVLCNLKLVEDNECTVVGLSKVSLSNKNFQQVVYEDGSYGLWSPLVVLPTVAIPPDARLATQITNSLKELVDESGKYRLDKSVVMGLESILSEKSQSLETKLNSAALLLCRNKHELAKFLQVKDAIDRCVLLAETLTASKRRLIPAKHKVKKEQLSFEQKIDLLPDYVKDEVRNDIQKLKNLQPTTLEYSVLVDYFNWLLSIPWDIFISKRPELSEIRTALDTSHHGLKDVKQHMLEYFAVESHLQRNQGTVLCFVGPPGTGKTSLAKAIADACNRSLQHIALGGVHEESVLRGFRRTYVASRPGRIVHSLKQAQSMDPLFLLDEVDKLDNSRGAASAYALLELLDPQQNNRFTDTYIEIPVDLSHAMFICTANYPERIPPELTDRVEIITFREYNKEEKLSILSDHIYPKLITEYNLDSLDITVKHEVFETLSTTRGIRDAERQMRKLLRKAIFDVYSGESSSVSLDRESINWLDSQPNSVNNHSPMGFRRGTYAANHSS